MRNITSLFRRSTPIVRPYLPTAPSRQRLTTVHGVTNAVFGSLHSKMGRTAKFFVSNDSDWEKAKAQIPGLQEVFDSYKTSLSPTNIRNQSVQGVQIQNTMQIQKLLDAIANAKDPNERVLYYGGVSSLLHEYCNISSKRLSPDAIKNVKAALAEQPDTLVRLRFKSIPLNVTFLNESDAQRILQDNRETVTSFGIPQNRLTNNMIQQDQANTKDAKPLGEKTYIQIGQVSIVAIGKPMIWSEGPRTYLKVTATTTDVHAFRDGFVEHVWLLDEETGMIHFVTLGGGDAPAGLFAQANVDSAASLWPNRDEVERLIYESGKPLNTFGTPEAIAQIVGKMGTTLQSERWVLKKLDDISPYTFPLKDNLLNNPLTRLTTTDSQLEPEVVAAIIATILAAIAISYANGEDYLLEDDATELKTEVDSIVQEEQKEPPPNPASEGTPPPSDTDTNKPDDFDPFKAEQDAQSPRNQDATEQVESGSSIPTNEGLANPEPINNPAEPDVFSDNRTEEEKARESLEEPREIV